MKDREIEWMREIRKKTWKTKTKCKKWRGTNEEINIYNKVNHVETYGILFKIKIKRILQ